MPPITALSSRLVQSASSAARRPSVGNLSQQIPLSAVAEGDEERIEDSQHASHAHASQLPASARSVNVVSPAAGMGATQRSDLAAMAVQSMSLLINASPAPTHASATPSAAAPLSQQQPSAQQRAEQQAHDDDADPSRHPSDVSSPRYPDDDMDDFPSLSYLYSDFPTRTAEEEEAHFQAMAAGAPPVAPPEEGTSDEGGAMMGGGRGGGGGGGVSASAHLHASQEATQVVHESEQPNISVSSQEPTQQLQEAASPPADTPMAPAAVADAATARVEPTATQGSTRSTRSMRSSNALTAVQSTPVTANSRRSPRRPSQPSSAEITSPQSRATPMRTARLRGATSQG